MLAVGEPCLRIWHAAPSQTVDRPSRDRARRRNRPRAGCVLRRSAVEAALSRGGRWQLLVGPARADFACIVQRDRVGREAVSPVADAQAGGEQPSGRYGQARVTAVRGSVLCLLWLAGLLG